MKRMFAVLVTLACLLTACGGARAQSASEQPQSVQKIESENRAYVSIPPASSETSEPAEDADAAESGARILVAYFSATGNTKAVARQIQTLLDADPYEIVPEEPYTSEDLAYSNDSCRANQEQQNSDARPAITGTLENPEEYEVVFLGYPLWWGGAPKILYTFLESYDFGDATIVPFCTSSSSGIGSSADDLQALTENAQWLEGRRFAAGASEAEVASWVESLDLSVLSEGAKASAAGETVVG